mgnify:CR=1 FL=1
MEVHRCRGSVVVSLGNVTNGSTVTMRLSVVCVTGVPHCRLTEQRSIQSMTDGGAQTGHAGSALSMGETRWGECVVLVLDVHRSVGHLQCAMRRFSPTAGDVSPCLPAARHPTTYTTASMTLGHHIALVHPHPR